MATTPDLLLEQYRQMLRIRLVEEEIARRYEDQEMRCPVHLCIGQEAVAVGVCTHLSSADMVMSAHRGHGHYLAQGGDLRGFIAELYGKATGCARGIGGSMHLIDLAAGFLGTVPIVGSTIPIAVGTAFGAVMRGDPRLSIVFLGEGATEEGVFHESVNFAVLKNLPVVFVCENNLYSVYSPMSVRQPEHRRVTDVARGLGVPSVQGDGNNVEEVSKLAGHAISEVRNGSGPQFLEFATYRWREHCGPYYDNDLGYRSPQEFEQWKKLCPIERLQSNLRQGVLTAEVEEAIRRDINAEIKDAFDFAEESPFPDKALVTCNVYA